VVFISVITSREIGLASRPRGLPAANRGFWIGSIVKPSSSVPNRRYPDVITQRLLRTAQAGGASHYAATAALQAAVQANRFGVMQVHNLKEIMVKKGVEFAHECLIFEVCQPQQAEKVLDQDLSVSTALPCRISIYEQGGKTILATLKLTALLAPFNVPQLEPVTREVEDAIVKIMKEAASG
jgi:uncharacterized protein (DUF302 family)